MSVTKKYSLSAVELADTVPVLISGITTQGIDTNTTIDSAPSSGEVYPQWQALTGQNPGGQFATFHLGTALAEIGLTGRSIAGLTNGLNLFLQKHAAGGTRMGASSHRKYNFTAGLIVPKTLTCQHRGNASISYQIIGIDDLQNAVVAVTESVTLPTAEADDERFTLGPVTIESIALPAVRALEIDFGVNAVSEGGDSDLSDTFISIETISPRITLRGIDPAWFTVGGIQLAGIAATHANTTIYLQKRAAGGLLVDPGALSHIKFTAAGLAYIENAFSASGPGAAESSVVFPLRYDPSNPTFLPLVINTASAIT